jgi:hypothetical protein
LCSLSPIIRKDERKRDEIADLSQEIDTSCQLGTEDEGLLTDKRLSQGGLLAHRGLRRDGGFLLNLFFGPGASASRFLGAAGAEFEGQAEGDSGGSKRGWGTHW